uniref:Uncharacterized protein n=1 Tax=Heterorhabditis bacteriophora TaxID=37862 RepID=A0A1I7W729_HETBA
MSDIIETEVSNHLYNYGKQCHSESGLSNDDLKRLFNLLPQCFPEEQSLDNKVSVVFRICHTNRFLKKYHDSLSRRFNGNPPFTLEKIFSNLFK